MQRWASAIFGVLVVAAVLIVVLNAVPSGAPEVLPAPIVSADAQPVRSVVPPLPSAPEPNDGPAHTESDEGIRSLPDSAPRSIEIGVIQLAYHGAERAPQDAPPRKAALERAKELIAAAQKDFDATVNRGDAGSAKDLGRIPRGVLEPEVEYEVFTLQPGEVTSKPLDTPRGYWIVRRNQ